MRWSLTLGRFGGTAVKIHITFIIFLAWIGFSAWRQEGPAAALNSVVFIVLIFLCVLLHEFGHVLMARRFGIPTSEVTLLPIGGVASLKRMPTQPIQEFLVAIAGPAVNLVIGAVLFLIAGGLGSDSLGRLDDPHVSLVARLAATNIFLAVFNLIPAFPMDGGRVLHALLAARLGGAEATRIAATIGQSLAFVFGFLGLFGNPLLLFIAVFIYIAAAAEGRESALHEALRGLTAAEAMETQFAMISVDADLGHAVDALLSSAQHEFPVVDSAGKPIGLLTREDILNALPQHDRATTAVSLMRSPAETVGASAPAEAALDRLEEKSTAALCVVDGDGAVIGLVTRHALAEVMMIKSLRPEWRLSRKA